MKSTILIDTPDKELLILDEISDAENDELELFKLFFAYF